ALLWVWYATDTPAQHSKVNSEELHWIRSDDREEAPCAAASTAMVTTGAGTFPRALPKIADAEGKWALLRNRSLILLTVSYAAVGYFEYLFYFWMHFYFGEVLKLGKHESRDYGTVLFLAMAAGMFLGGWLADYLALAWG